MVVCTRNLQWFCPLTNAKFFSMEFTTMAYLSFALFFSTSTFTYLTYALVLSRDPTKLGCLAPMGAAGAAPVKADDRRLGVPGDSDLRDIFFYLCS